MDVLQRLTHHRLRLPLVRRLQPPNLELQPLHLPLVQHAHRRAVAAAAAAAATT